jgi:outer membrane protein
MIRPLALVLLLAASPTPPALAAEATASPAAREAAGNPPGADGPLTLEQAVATALAHQPLLLSARAQTRAAKARASQGNSFLLPQAGLTASATRSQAPSSFGGGSTTGDVYSLGLSASQTLFDANAWYGASAGRSAAAAQVETERATRLAVVLAVETAWYQAAAARDLVEVAKETLANREAHLAQVKGFVEVGTRPEIDLAQARADRSSSVVQVIATENSFATAHAQLNQAMGVAASTDYALAPAALVPLAGEEGSIEALLAEALAARPEVAARARQREAQVATVRAAQGGYLPAVGATGKLGEVGPAVDETQRTWSAGVTLTWNLFAGGYTSARTSEAQANLDALDADDEAFRQQVRLDLEQARLAVRSAKAGLEATAEVVVNARERLRLAEARYQAGLGSGLELSDAQVAVTDAAAQEVKARFTLATARAQLAQSLGRS